MSISHCARYHFDSHVVKMILEYCQLLSTAWHITDKDKAYEYYSEGKICKSTHVNHPSAIWVRKHINNYTYLIDLALKLCEEWRMRYGHPKTKKHGCEDKLLFLKENLPPLADYDIRKDKTNPNGFTIPMPQAMYDDCKVNPERSTVFSCRAAYRKYYMSDYKKHLRKWTFLNPYKRDGIKRLNLGKPPWWVE